MVRWWAAFFICGMVFPPGPGDASIVLAAAAAGFFASSVRVGGSPLGRARLYCLVAIAGGIVLWQAAGVGRAHHDASWTHIRTRGETAGAEGPLDRISLPGVKARLARTLDDGRLPERARALVAALVLDERSGLRRPLRDAYSYLGITHFLALSGLHLGVMACALSGILARIVPGARRREAILLAILAGYCAVVCFPPSLVRSYALIAVVAGYRATGLSCDLFGALAVGSFAVSCVDPTVPFDAGFQLSFAAVCGIAFIGMPIVRRVDARLPKGWTGGTARALVYPAIVTCAVQFLTMPLTVGLFGRASLASPLANVAVSFPFTALLYAGMVYVFVPVGIVRDILAPPIALVCRFLDTAPAWLARKPHPAVLGGETNWVLYGCGVIAVAHALGPSCRRRAACASAGAILVLGAFVVPGGKIEGDGELAGRGFRYIPDGGGVLFVGSRFGEREARSLVRELWKRGGRGIDCCVVVPSHLRRGHGWRYLAARMAVGRCLASPYLARAGGWFRDSCEKAGIECVAVSTGDRPAAGGLILEVLGPAYPPPAGKTLSSRSARLLCRLARGDAPAGSEEEGIDPDEPGPGRMNR